MKPASAAVRGGACCPWSVRAIPRTVAPTPTTTMTIERMWAFRLWVVQSLDPFVVCSVDQSLEFLGEFCVELSESFDESPDECDESFETFDESLDEFDESPEPFDESDPLLEPELDW